MNAIVLGATGATGRGLVTLLARDPLIKKVTAVVRREINVKETYILVDDSILSKITPLVVDFDNLIAKDFEGFDIGFSALGMYSSAMKSDEQWKAIELDYNIRYAELLHQGGTKRFSYLSGSGSTINNPERSRQRFVRIKGATEIALAKVGFETFMAARSGGILGRSEVGVASAYPYIEWAFEWIKYTRFGMTAVQLAGSMIESTISEPIPPLFMEAPDLKRLSKQYFQRLEERKKK